MATAVQTAEALEAGVTTPGNYELQPVRHSESRRPHQGVTTQGEEAVTPRRSPSSPVFKIISAGFSFFSAGVNDGTLGPLLPYMLASFSIGTGEVAAVYGTTFAGWLLAAVTNPVLTAQLTLGQLLALGAGLQLLAQCLRPWAPFPLFCVTFFVQALGMAYQDAHSNTFVSSVNLAHRWLGFIHAMYALGCLTGPLIATAIAVGTSTHLAETQSSTGAYQAAKGAGDGWRKTYFVLVSLSAVNMIGVVVSFRDTLLRWGSTAVEGTDAATRATAGDTATRGKKSKVAMLEMAEMLKVRNVWIISMFYFFEIGACLTAGGWVVEYLVTIRHGNLSKMGYVPTGYYGGVFLGRLLLAEPTFRFGEKRMILLYSAVCIAMQLLFWLLPNIIADATALSVMGFFYGPFFATGVSVASKIFPRKVQAAALSFVFVMAQAGGAFFPSITGSIASCAGVQVLQPIVLTLVVSGAIFWWLLPKVTCRSTAVE